MSSPPPPSYSLNVLQLASGCLPSSNAWHRQRVAFQIETPPPAPTLLKMPAVSFNKVLEGNSGDLMVTSTYINSKSFIASLFLCSC